MSMLEFTPPSHARCHGAIVGTDMTRGPETGARVARAGLIALSLVCATPQAQAAEDKRGEYNGAALRAYIASQVGGLRNLQVPAQNANIPVPRQPDGTVNHRYETTEAKRYLGKMLFHDPVRTVRINENAGQPVDLPAGTAFGGTESASNPNIQDIVRAQRQTGSCGSCHIGEAAGKAGQVLNFNVGGEGRGYTDEQGNFIPRRRPQSILTKQRSEPIFPGDALVDMLPTLTDIDLYREGSRAGVVVTNPANFYHTPPPSALLATGRLDELDSVGRESPSLVGAAYNNRLLLGGFAGEPQSAPGSLNPFEDPAQENLTLLLLDAHRMLNFEAAALQQVPSFVKLFQNAFPEEAAAAAGSHDLNDLINDQTVFRATATFLRTLVTRNTPFDRFLAGDDNALTDSQKRGAYLFYTPAAGKAQGAGCVSCHNGPMLNKQSDDPDVAGIGKFVEENFFNVGIGDHPVQALNAAARNQLTSSDLGKDGFPYHAQDTGRQEVTFNAGDAFKFRSLTLRQLKDGRTFFHNGSFTTVREAVEYFNAGIPQDPTAGAAPTLSDRFTHPRGPGHPRGLGLTERQVGEITDFLENALYDPAFVQYDPKSTTDTFQPNEHDLTYSKYYPDLAALGAKDGLMPSGLAIDDNDPLARRDQGLEFLDVTEQCAVSQLGQPNAYQIKNVGSEAIDTNLLVVVSELPQNIKLVNASGTTSGGDPYLRLYLRDGAIKPGDSVAVDLHLSGQASTPHYKLTLLSGQGRQVSYP